MRVIYPGFIASAFRSTVGKYFNATVDQHQGNGAFGVHQLRCRLPGDETTYRIIIAPADAPICVGKVPADLHFQEPIHG